MHGLILDKRGNSRAENEEPNNEVFSLLLFIVLVEFNFHFAKSNLLFDPDSDDACGAEALRFRLHVPNGILPGLVEAGRVVPQLLVWRGPRCSENRCRSPIGSRCRHLLVNAGSISDADRAISRAQRAPKTPGRKGRKQTALTRRRACQRIAVPWALTSSIVSLPAPKASPTVLRRLRRARQALRFRLQT